MLESEADRLAMVQAVGEPFSTAKAEKLWLVFDREYLAQQLGEFTTDGRNPLALGRTSDIAQHELVKQSVITRDADGAKYSVKQFKPDGVGMTLLVLSA